MAVKRRLFYEYRVRWGHVGGDKSKDRVVQSEKLAPVLSALRRVGTDTPWMGSNKTSFRKCWARLCFRLDVPFTAVADMSVRDVLRAIQASFGKLRFITVEFRQVGQWTELLDPLDSLRSANQDKLDKKRLDTLDQIGAMTREDLDKWRAYLSEDYRLARRRRGRK